MGQPTCDTPGCGKPIPKGAEGHPEICPTCLDLDDRLNHSAAGAKRACLQGVVATLRSRASALFSEKKDDMAYEVRRIADEFEKESAVATKVLDGFIARRAAKR